MTFAVNFFCRQKKENGYKKWCHKLSINSMVIYDLILNWCSHRVKRVIWWNCLYKKCYVVNYKLKIRLKRSFMRFIRILFLIWLSFLIELIADFSRECIDHGFIPTSTTNLKVRHFQVDPFNGFAFWIEDKSIIKKVTLIKPFSRLFASYCFQFIMKAISMASNVNNF